MKYQLKSINNNMKYTFIIVLCINTLFATAQPRHTRDGQTTSNVPDLFNSIKELITKPAIFESALIQTVGKDYKTLNENELLTEIEKSNEILNTYSKKVDDFLASKPNSSYYERDRKYTIQKCHNVKYEIEQVEKTLANERSISFVYSLQKLEIKKIYIQNMLKIFPNETSLNDDISLINAFFQKVGSPQQFMKTLAGNQAKYIANLKMSPPATKDSKVESFVKNEFKKIQMDGLKYDVTKVNITRSHWIIEKNDLGIPTYQWISACMAVKTTDGKCGIATTYIRKDYAGGGTYGSQYLYTPTSIEIVPCENIN